MASTCVVCDVSLAAYSAREYRDKLIEALHHPSITDFMPT